MASDGSETAVVRAQDETPNDRNDRGTRIRPPFILRSILTNTCGPHAPGIRKATAWYSSHISLINPTIRGQHPKPKPAVLLLTDDAQNRIKGEKEGTKCSSGKVSPPRYEGDFKPCQ
jgi:exosome complex exonuclease DIS3/RRP44